MPRSIADFISLIVALLIGITVHEFAHAWTADELGDPTSRNQGRLTLNPLAHLDPLGSLMILFAGFGWGKPVPVNPYLLRTDPTVGMALVSFAGPLSNVLTAFLFALPIRFGLLHPTFPGRLLPSAWGLVQTIVFLNLILAVFNLIPLAPLDGYKVALAVLPRDWARKWQQLETYGPIILILLVFLPTLLPGAMRMDILGRILFPPTQFLFSLFTGR